MNERTGVMVVDGDKEANKPQTRKLLGPGLRTAPEGVWPTGVVDHAHTFINICAQSTPSKATRDTKSY